MTPALPPPPVAPLPTPGPAEPRALSVGSTIGGWRLVRLLGRGGMAEVYEAIDVIGTRRAIKLLHATLEGGEAERRFRREFRALSRLQHPNIARVFEHGQAGGRAWFVLELVEGQDLRAAVETWTDLGPARFELARSILIQAARALEYIHLRGLVHRDVTPSNLMLLPDGTVRLMDFGVVKDSEAAEATVQGEVLGTVAYVAPEQIAGGHVDARTDLYSLGAVLYLMLTGRRPFHARTAAGYLEKHLHAPPRPPHELVAGVPALLEEVCMRLLAKDPAERFASATHLLHVLEGHAHAAVTYNADEWPPSLVGRAEAVATVLNAVGACREGQGGVIFVSGTAGSGKTRLLRLARDQARRIGVPTFILRPSPGEAPLHALRPLVEALASQRPPMPAVLRRFYADDGEREATFERFEVYAGFRELLGGGGPRVLLVDDVHLGDAVSIELTEYLIRSTTSLAGEPILWILSATPGVQDLRLEGLLHGTTLEATPQALTLKPLDASAVEELVLSILPDQPATRALAARLHREGEGNPAFIAEMLRGMREAGFLVAREGHLTLSLSEDAVGRATLPVPRSVRENAETRLAEAGTDARAVARALAIATQDLTFDVLAEIVGLGDDRVMTALDVLVDSGLVRERLGEVEERYDLALPRLADVIRGALSEDESAQLHRRVGEALERACRRRLHLVVESLALHFEAGHVPGKAFPYLIRAGQRLQGRSFVAEAASCYTRAIALEDEIRGYVPLEDADRQLCEALLLRADAWEHLGQPVERLADVQRADRLAGELGEERLQSRVTSALARMARRSEDLDRAEALYQEALRLADLAGEPGLRVSPLQGLAGIRWARKDLDGARRWWGELLALGDSRRDDRALAYGYNGLGLAALSRGEAAEARRNFERAVELFEKLGLLGSLSAARVNLVEIHHFTGNLRRGLELAERAVSHARETRHRLGMSRGLCFRSLLLVDLGRTAEGLQDGVASVAIARELGDADDEVACQVTAIRAAWAAGEPERVRTFLNEVMPVVEKHDAEGFLPLLHAWWARLAAHDGDPDAARTWLALADHSPAVRWPYQECRLDLTLARVYLALGDRVEATRRAENAVRRADAAGFRFYSLRGHCLAAMISEDEATVARHRRVADALARSLASNLPREDAERFLAQDWLVEGVGRRPTRIERVVEREETPRPLRDGRL